MFIIKLCLPSYPGLISNPHSVQELRITILRTGAKASGLRYSRQLQTSHTSVAASKMTSKPVSIPRPSASLVIVNAKNEVLMVERHSDSHSFAGAHVFPGGNFDKVQDSSLEMTAIRETFEETGVLLASRVRDSSKTVELSENASSEARRAIHAGKLLFTDFLSECGLVADTASLLPFSTWITPPQLPRRFRARFFVTFLHEASALAGPSSGTHTHRLPTPDSADDERNESYSTEVVSARYVHPGEALAAFSRGEIGLMPPQFYILTTLNDIFRSGPDGDSNANVNTPMHREQVRRLARGAFGRMEFNPRYLDGAPRKSADGTQVMVLEGDEARGGKKGYLHRTIFIPQKGTPVPLKLALTRNFDIFTGLDCVSPPAPKL